MIEMTEEQWVEHYKPMTNYFTNDGTSYETYGDDLEYILQQDDKHVWTEMDGDDGVYIVSGYHIANRIAYYVTNVPWQEDACITIAKYVVCDCYDVNDEETEPDENCEQCWGEGTYTDWE